MSCYVKQTLLVRTQIDSQLKLVDAFCIIHMKITIQHGYHVSTSGLLADEEYPNSALAYYIKTFLNYI